MRFIEMCKSLKELQDGWKPESGDKYFFKTCRGCKPLVTPPHCEGFSIKFNPEYLDGHTWKDDKFWLPSLDDMVNMLQDVSKTTNDLLPYSFTEQNYLGDIWDKGTVLDFMAQELYHKRWNWEEEKWEDVDAP